MGSAGREGGDGAQQASAPGADGLGVAAIATLGAGAIHAAAVGAHGEQLGVAVAFAVVALFQLGWGLAALLRPSPAVRRWGVAGNGVALLAWVLAKTTGIPLIEGFRAAEGPGFPDTAAAVLAGVAVAATLRRVPARAGTGVRPAWRPVPMAALAAPLVLAAMVATGGHDHADADGHDAGHAQGSDETGHEHDDHDEDGAGHEHGSAGHDDGGDGHAHGPDEGGAATSYDHGPDDHTHDGGGDDREGAPDHTHDDGGDGGGHRHDGDGGDGGDGGGHEHDGDGGDDGDDGDGGSGLTRPYDATIPVDLSGVPGVTPEQQASAEALVTDTLLRLPQFADPATIGALGYRTVGDAFTGYEHFVNWPLIDDGRILDADHPEALVYRVDGGRRTLVAAMYMLGPGSTLDTVPDVGGPLVQWHVHADLCWSGEENAWQVASVVAPPRSCPAGTFRLEAVPMIHVWIVPHPCGPFAALEGVSGGQVREGEEVLCHDGHSH